MKGGIDLHVWEETGDSTHSPPYLLLVHENIPGGAKTGDDKQKAIEERAKAKAMLREWAKDVAAMNRRAVLQSEFRNKRCVVSNVLKLTL